MTGYQGHALLAIPITGSGDVTGQIKWKADRGTPYVPSAILYGDQLYFTQSNQGILTSLKASDGSEVIERTRVPDLGDIYASPVGADGRIYFVGRKGTTVVIDHGSDSRCSQRISSTTIFTHPPPSPGNKFFFGGCVFFTVWKQGLQLRPRRKKRRQKTRLQTRKKALSAKLKAMVDSGKISGEESVELYLTAFPEEAENVKRMLAERTNAVKDRKLLAEIAKRELPKDYPEAMAISRLSTSGSKQRGPKVRKSGDSGSSSNDFFLT